MDESAVSDLPPVRSRYDVVVVGGGHNGLTAAAYLARAGRSVLVLERLDHLGGAAVSARLFDGMDVRLSRYSYLVSLLPRRILDDLGLRLRLVRRRWSSYTPVPARPSVGLLVDDRDDAATAASFARIGAASDHQAWQRFYARTRQVARQLFPTLTGPLPSAAQTRALIGDESWDLLVGHPIGQAIATAVTDDTVRGVALTDALIGTFADADEPSLRQNRCFLYHVIGGGTGHWDVPVGGMGAVTAALADAARSAGAELRTSARVRDIEPVARHVTVTWTEIGAGGSAETAAAAGDLVDGGEHTVDAGYVLAGCAPAVLDRLLRRYPSGPAPSGAQLKVNMVLSRLPRLRDPEVDPSAAFGGTFHVNEGYEQLRTAHRQAARGLIPDLPPCEVYCHSLSDPSILGPRLRAAGAHTLTLFGLHMPAELFRTDTNGRTATRDEALAATLCSLDSVLAEPIQDCLLHAPSGEPCLEARSPVDLEREVALPGGHIFHTDLSWPWAERDDEVGRWGVETDHPRVLIAGAGARRGGGVSGIGGHNAAMAVLDADR
ncbi:MAG: phytoene desaturase family protein [Angustibacter sp.]